MRRLAVAFITNTAGVTIIFIRADIALNNKTKDFVQTLLARISFLNILYVFLGKATASRRTPKSLPRSIAQRTRFASVSPAPDGRKSILAAARLPINAPDGRLRRKHPKTLRTWNNRSDLLDRGCFSRQKKLTRSPQSFKKMKIILCQVYFNNIY